MSSPRLQALLAWLILQAHTPQPRERLASLLWPESSGSQARTNLRQLVHHLKHALPEQCNNLVMDQSSISWQRSEACSIDVVQFETAIAAAAEWRLSGHSLGEIEALTTAALLYGDDLLPSVYDAWLVPIREKLRGRLSTALHRLAVLLEDRGEVQTAIDWTEKLVTHDSLRESNYQLLFRLHVANCDRASALRTYHRLKTVLRRELGVAPGPDTIEIFERALRNTQPSLSNKMRPASEVKKERPLVGRTSEIKLLNQAWDRVAKGSAHAVLLSGEPGIGKTRLAEHLIQALEQQHSIVARARCYSGNGQVAYAPIAEWLRSGPLRLVWPNLSPAQRIELARLVPEILKGESLPDEPQSPLASWHKVRLYQALKVAFTKTSDPTLLFLDDLQWCDAESLEWILMLLNGTDTGRFLFLGTVRSEETGRGHPYTQFLAQLRQSGVVSEIPLSPLNVVETIELVKRESLEAVLESRLEAIIRSTKGNPLFILESVRSGTESPRIHAVISARLANLSAASYELAGLAGVIDRPFSFELLEKASDWDSRSISVALDELWQRRIIEGSGGAEYDFTHDHLREVVKAELSPVRARYLHRRVALALAETYQDDSQEWSGQIASHYEQASMAQHAIKHLLLAAKSERQRFAYSNAAILLNRALSLNRQIPASHRGLQQELDILLLLGTVLVTTDGYSAPEVGITYGRALELARKSGGDELLSSLSGLWVFHVVRGEVEISRQNALEFLESVGGQVSSDLTLAGNFLLGSSLCHLGEFEAAHGHLSLALDAFEGQSESVLEVFGGPDVRTFCRAYLAHVAWHRSPNDEDRTADIYITDAVQIAKKMRHPFIQAIALIYATMLHALNGDSCLALEVGRQAIALCCEHDFSYYLAMANVLTAWALSTEGGALSGIEQFRDGLDSMRRLGAELRLPYFYALLAQTYLRANLLREASACLSTGFAFATKNGETWTLAELHRVQGDLLVSEGKLDQAIASYKRGLDVARACGSFAFERRLAAATEKTEGLRSLERS